MLDLFLHAKHHDDEWEKKPRRIYGGWGSGWWKKEESTIKTKMKSRFISAENYFPHFSFLFFYSHAFPGLGHTNHNRELFTWFGAENILRGINEFILVPSFSFFSFFVNFYSLNEYIVVPSTNLLVWIIFFLVQILKARMLHSFLALSIFFLPHW